MTLPAGSRIVTAAPASPVPVMTAPSTLTVAVSPVGAVMSAATTATMGEALPAASVCTSVSVSPLACGVASGTEKLPSAATVAVLPEAEEVDLQIDDKDLRIDIYRSSGAGGQHVNTTDSAIRITHIPTGLVVIQQDERSQHKNRAKAMKVLRTRLYEAERERLASERAGARRSMVGSGDRSERIRTYNFPQGRVTDHRINLTLHRLPEILEGELDELVGALLAEDEAERLAALDG